MRDRHTEWRQTDKDLFIGDGCADDRFTDHSLLLSSLEAKTK